MSEKVKTSFGFHRHFWPRFFQQTSVKAGLLLILVVTAGCAFSNVLTIYPPNQQGDLLTSRYLPPSSEHPFGTDKFARDVFSRVLYGGRISLIIAFSVVALSISLGVLYGTVSGYAGGFVDVLMMRVLDFLLAFPAIYLVLTVVTVCHANHWYLIPVLGLTGWMETARMVRAEVISIKERDFVLAAKGLGFSHFRILFFHIVPNCLNPVIVTATFKVGEVILLESALSFLGLGVQPPTPSWGSIINDGRQALLNAWWVSTFPGMFIVLVVIGFNLIGEGLRVCLNPRE
ncbi:MAG: ABC transporter permease [bacterium]